LKLQTVVSALKTAGSNQNSYQELKKENELLKSEIERYKTILSGGQVNPNPLPTATVTVKPPISGPAPESQKPAVKPQPKKEKPEKKPAADKKLAEKKTEEEPPVDIGRLDLRVGRIIKAEKHPDAESLYVEQVDSC